MTDTKTSNDGTADDSDGIDRDYGAEYAERGLRLLGEAVGFLNDMVQDAIQRVIEEERESRENDEESAVAANGSEAA
jgi:hypothetical protein